MCCEITEGQEDKLSSERTSNDEQFFKCKNKKEEERVERVERGTDGSERKTRKERAVHKAKLFLGNF